MQRLQTQACKSAVVRDRPSYSANRFKFLNRQKSSATAESIKKYYNLINTTKANLEDRLESIDTKLKLILKGNAATSKADAQEVKLIQEEQLSTEKCLQIYAKLSNYIAQIQLTLQGRSSGKSLGSAGQLLERITSEGLQECKDSLSRTAKKLEGYKRELFTRLINKLTALVALDDRADLIRLRDQQEATRQSIKICV